MTTECKDSIQRYGIMTPEFVIEGFMKLVRECGNGRAPFDRVGQESRVPLPGSAPTMQQPVYRLLGPPASAELHGRVKCDRRVTRVAGRHAPGALAVVGRWEAAGSDLAIDQLWRGRDFVNVRQ